MIPTTDVDKLLALMPGESVEFPSITAAMEAVSAATLKAPTALFTRGGRFVRRD